MRSCNPFNKRVLIPYLSQYSSSLASHFTPASQLLLRWSASLTSRSQYVSSQLCFSRLGECLRRQISSTHRGNRNGYFCPRGREEAYGMSVHRPSRRDIPSSSEDRSAEVVIAGVDKNIGGLWTAGRVAYELEEEVIVNPFQAFF